MNDYRLFAGAFIEGELAEQIQAIRQKAEGFDRLYYVSIEPPGSYQVVEWIETETNMPDGTCFVL